MVTTLVLVVVAGCLPVAALASEPDHDRGTVPEDAAAPAVAGAEEINVTAVTTNLVALDQSGNAVLDLRAEEIEVYEDEQPAVVLELIPGLGPSGIAQSSQAADQSADTEESEGLSRPWRVVVYVSTELAGRFVLPALCRSTAAQAPRLTALGPVDIVLADPSPHFVARAGDDPEALTEALEQLASEASGVTSVEKIRRSFLQDFKPGVGFNQSYTITQSSPATFAARARAAVQRERTIIRHELDRLVMWMQSQPPTTKGLLIWLTGGFDINPSDFYIPLVEQLDPFLARTLRSDHQTSSLQPEVVEIVEAALAFGWTVLPLNSSRLSFAHGAEYEGTGKAQHLGGVGANSIAAQGGEFRQVAPNYPLQMVARGTGGEFVASEANLENALGRARSAYQLTYQTERPADGELHRLEMKCTRPGVRLRGRQYATSGSLRAVAVTRGRQYLAGDHVSGGLDMSATLRNITRSKRGEGSGDLRVTADLTQLRTVLSAVDLGRIRVTIVVEVEDGKPFVHHQELGLDWEQVKTYWTFGAPLKWPKDATRLAVVVEELVSSTWAVSAVDLD